LAPQQGHARGAAACGGSRAKMGLSEERKAQFSEAFELLGSKKAEIPKDVLGQIMRSLGQNPTNDEVTAAFNKHSSGAGLTLDSVLTICGEFEAGMASQDQKGILKEAFAVFDKDKSGTISAAYACHA
jgi:Ca2+-binding EF-hand superfamily protein